MTSLRFVWSIWKGNWFLAVTCVTMFIGDSIIKLEKTFGYRIVVKLFSRAIKKAMWDYLKANLEHSPDRVVLHDGTNDIKLKNRCKLSTRSKANRKLIRCHLCYNGAVKKAKKHQKSCCR